MARTGLRRAGLVLAGFIMGLLGLAIGIWFYLQAGRVDEARSALGARVQLAREAIERTEFIEETALRIALRDVALLEETGDTILAAPRMVLTLDATSLEGSGPIEFYDVHVEQPLARLVRSPDGEWNFSRAFQLTAAGEPVRTEEGRGFLFRSIEITDGDLTLALPAAPSAPAALASFTVNRPRTQLGGVPYDIYQVRGLDAELPLVRIGGERGWRAELAALQGTLVEPEMRISQLAGAIEQEGSDGFRFDLETLRFGDSRLSGGGRVRLDPAGIDLDVELSADPLLFTDLLPLLPDLPPEGSATFEVAITSIGNQRIAVRAAELDLDAADSRILGSIGVAFGGGAPLSLLSANLELAPLELSSLTRLGFVEELPVLGQVRGRVTSEGAPSGYAHLDVSAALVPSDAPGSTPSLLLAAGNLSLSQGDEPLRLDGVNLAFRPLYLSALRSFLPEQQEFLRGTIEGSATVEGVLSQLRVAGGELTYRVGEAPPTRLVDLAGVLRTEPVLSYEFSAVAQPISLGTLTELFPTLPLQPASLSGPLALSGNSEGLELSANLTSSSGGVRFAGLVAFAEPMRFDISGSLDAFVSGMILRPDVPVEGPLSGTFAVQGTADEFDFDVDLAQTEGSFALRGTINTTISPPRFLVSGRIDDFRIGSLLGAPELFPDPMTGPIAVEGGGGAPYRFDVDLAGAIGRLDLEGSFLPGTVPSYQITGFVAGLDLSRLPLESALPPTNLTGSVEARGSGLTLENLAGSYAFDFSDSRLSGQALDTAVGRFQAQGGILEVDTLHVQLERSQLRAAGSWGLSRPAAAPLRFALTSPDLSVLSRVLAPTALIPPELSGSLTGSGEVSGSLDYPRITGNFIGRNLRFEEWRAEATDIQLDAERTPSRGWTGFLSLAGDNLVLPGPERLESVRLEASGDEEALALGLYARRTLQRDLALSGLLELDGLIPRGIALETLDLRLDGATWTLLNPARLHYSPEEGLAVENLVLERAGPQPGLIEVFGVVPPVGSAGLTLRTTGFDLADLNRITPAAPQLEGTLELDALLAGPVASPELSIRGRIDELRFEDVATEQIVLDGTYAGGRLVGSAGALTEGVELLRAEFEVPMELSLAQLTPAFELLRANPLRILVLADSLPLSLVAAAVPGLSQGVGVARAEIDVVGTLDAPVLEGWARIEEGALTIDPLSARYSQIRAELLLQGNRIVVNELSARSGGTIQASGTIDFPPGASPLAELTANFRDFRVMDDPRTARLTASGNLALTGPLTQPLLTGQVQVSESTIQVPELGAEQPGLELGYLDVAQLAPIPEEGLTVVPPILGNVQVEGVQVSLAEGVWLESSELRVQIGGDLVLYRTGDELRVFGALQAIRGTYALEISSLIREFDVISGRVQFFGTGDLNPSLDILAGYRVRSSTLGSGRDLTVLVHLTGTVLAPRLELTSDTPVALSEADLISYLLFGQPSFELGGVTRSFAEQILVQEFVGGLIASELERPILRANICDWVRVRPGVTTSFRNLFGVSGLAGAVIECGRAIAPDLFLTAQAGIGGLFAGDFTEGRVGLEWQIDNEWMWEASYGTVIRDPFFQSFAPSPPTQFSTDLRRNWEYGRPRERAVIDFSEGLLDDLQEPGAP